MTLHIYFLSTVFYVKSVQKYCYYRYRMKSCKDCHYSKFAISKVIISIVVASSQCTAFVVTNG